MKHFVLFICLSASLLLLNLNPAVAAEGEGAGGGTTMSSGGCPGGVKRIVCDKKGSKHIPMVAPTI